MMDAAIVDFQRSIDLWMQTTFGPEISADTEERNWRFIEEAIELVQACGCSKEDVLKLVDYVYSRPVGDPPQEVGGVVVTLAALCTPHQIDLQTAALDECARVWANADKIRAKQARKPLNNSPLPGSS